MKPFDVLSLPLSATPEQVRARWHELANLYHPDKGGDVVRFREFAVAYEAALKVAEEPKPCVRCQDTRYITVTQGFSSTKIVCPLCLVAP